jgi:competence protein ComEC
MPRTGATPGDPTPVQTDAPPPRSGAFNRCGSLAREPFVPLFVAIAGGVLASRFTDFGIRELAFAIGALAALAVFARWKSTRRVALAACFGALFFAGALIAVAHKPGPAPELDVEAREVVILGGCVVGPPAIVDGREQFPLELEPGARIRLSLYAKENAPLSLLRYGQKIEVEARTRQARNYWNPGAFDFEGYLARQHIYWTASGDAASLRVLPGECGNAFDRAIFAIRAAAIQRIDDLYRGDDYKTAMMRGVLMGELTHLEKVWTDDFRRTGTYHCLVISGLHVAVLAGFFLFLLRLCFLSQGAASAITSIAIWLYAFVTGLQAPAVRAAAAFTLFALARFVFRRARLMNLLAACAVGFIVFDPQQMFDASFQLSFLSVAAIGVLAVPLIERTSAPFAAASRALADTGRDPRFAPRIASIRVELRLLAETLALWTRLSERASCAVVALGVRCLAFVYEMAVLSGVVQFGLVLPMAVYFHRVSATGLTANLLIVPMMAAVVPIGFVALFTGWSLPAILAGWLLTASQWVAAVHAHWEPNWRVPDPPLWLALAFTATLIAAAQWRRKLFLAASFCLFAVIVWHPFPPQIERGSLELTAIDVGQGDGLFVAFPDGKMLVLDAGGFPAIGNHKSRIDTGEDVVSPYLWSRSIRRIDAVAISHGHADHIGGIPAVIDNFHPKELWIGAIPESPDWALVREAARREGVRIVTLRAGQNFSFGGTNVEVLAPAVDYVPLDTAKNDDSLVLRIRHGRHSMLLAGDIERPVERELVENGQLERTDVLKVAHHGSRTSSTEPFLEAVHPAFGIVSVGYENSFHHPHPDVVRRLEDAHMAVLRTDLWGLVSIRTDGRRFRLDTMRWSRGETALDGVFGASAGRLGFPFGFLGP